MTTYEVLTLIFVVLSVPLLFGNIVFGLTYMTFGFGLIVISVIKSMALLLIVFLPVASISRDNVWTGWTISLALLALITVGPGLFRILLDRFNWFDPKPVKAEPISPITSVELVTAYHENNGRNPDRFIFQIMNDMRIDWLCHKGWNGVRTAVRRLDGQILFEDYPTSGADLRIELYPTAVNRIDPKNIWFGARYCDP